MTLPPSQDVPDDLISAYRRASARDASEPSPQVRDIILNRAARRSKTAQRARARAWALSWQWRTAASLAVVGLVGVLTSQILHTPRREPERRSAASASAPTVAAASPTNDLVTSTPTPSTPLHRTAGAAALESVRPTVPASASKSLPEAAQDPVVAPAPAAPSGARARSADLVERNSVVAATSPDPWKIRTLEALRNSYPELFGTSERLGEARPEPVRIALVMNQDGSVYKTAYEPGKPEDQTSAVRLTLALGVNPLELAAPARLIVFDRGIGQPARIDVMVGIRKSR
jgi:hypothetical protein